MVNSIRGTLTFKTPGVVGVDTGGVEWALETTASSISRLPSAGSEVRVFTYLHHVQDSMRFYGFATAEERTLFLALISVNGVGPSLARKILSGITESRFIAALESEDLETLGSVPGLGKKTAQKIILQLRGKLASEEDTDATGTSGAQEVVDALAAMGFDARGAGKTVAAIMNDAEVLALSGEQRDREVLRRAIIALSS